MLRPHRRIGFVGIGVALALGAVTTLAIALVSACRDPMARYEESFDVARRGEHCSICLTRASTWITRCSWEAISDVELREYVDPSVPSPDRPPYWSRARRPDLASAQLRGGDFHREVAAGWPLRAMLCPSEDDARWKVTGVPLAVPLAEQNEIIFPGPNWVPGPPPPKPRPIPVEVIPFGFAVDTALFASSWWLALLGIPTARSIVRRRRRACSRCGYGPLESRERGCPECGWNRE